MTGRRGRVGRETLTVVADTTTPPDAASPIATAATGHAIAVSLRQAPARQGQGRAVRREGAPGAVLKPRLKSAGRPTIDLDELWAPVRPERRVEGSGVPARGSGDPGGAGVADPRGIHVRALRSDRGTVDLVVVRASRRLRRRDRQSAGLRPDEGRSADRLGKGDRDQGRRWRRRQGGGRADRARSDGGDRNPQRHSRQSVQCARRGRAPSGRDQGSRRRRCRNQAGRDVAAGPSGRRARSRGTGAPERAVQPWRYALEPRGRESVQTVAGRQVPGQYRSPEDRHRSDQRAPRDAQCAVQGWLEQPRDGAGTGAAAANRATPAGQPRG